MFKKLLFLLILIDICGFSLAFRALTVELPWFAARGTQSTAEIETPVPVQPEAILPSATTSELPATPVPTGMSINPTSYLTSNGEQLSLISICFAPEEILPFAFTPVATRFLVRASSGLQIFDLETDAGACLGAFSSLGGSLLSATDGRDIRIWRAQDGKLLYIGKSACP